jgi:hypothetical protein
MSAEDKYENINEGETWKVQSLSQIHFSYLLNIQLIYCPGELDRMTSA